MTFSLIARCERTGQFGLVVSSSSPAVAARCAHVRAGVGAVASQNITDPELGPKVLDAMARGENAEQALGSVLKGYEFAAFRQVLAIDRYGLVASHSGSNVLGINGKAHGVNCIAAGNLLANDNVPGAMVKTFEMTKGSLAHRIMSALEAGLASGGEAGPVYSAGLKVADKLSWPYIDLRVDWTVEPIAVLREALKAYEPQADAYVQRAINPTVAPRFGVPGDK